MSFMQTYLPWFMGFIAIFTWLFLGFLYVKTPLLDWIENRFFEDTPPEPGPDAPFDPAPPLPFRYVPLPQKNGETVSEGQQDPESQSAPNDPPLLGAEPPQAPNSPPKKPTAESTEPPKEKAPL